MPVLPALSLIVYLTHLHWHRIGVELDGTLEGRVAIAATHRTLVDVDEAEGLQAIFMLANLALVQNGIALVGTINRASGCRIDTLDSMVGYQWFFMHLTRNQCILVVVELLICMQVLFVNLLLNISHVADTVQGLLVLHLSS